MANNVNLKRRGSLKGLSHKILLGQVPMPKIRSSSTKETRIRRSSRDDESAGIEKPESFVFKYLTLEQTQALLELNIDVLQEKMSEYLLLDGYETSLSQVIVLDYYVAGLWFAKEQGFSPQQGSGFFTLLKVLLENIQDKKMNFEENMKYFRQLMSTIGEIYSPLSCFDNQNSKVIIDYFMTSLYQHYKLYKNFFTTDQEQENLHLAYDIEHPPILNIDYPLPMDEGISEQVLQLDEQAKAEEAEAQKAREEAELLAAQIEEAKDEGTVEENKQDEVELVPEESTLPLKDVKDLIKTVTNDVLDGLQVDVNQKLRDREAVMLNKINRIQNYLRN
ncbi:Uncharacterized protein C10orf107 [Trichoplax sp. H2]|nr:Uncharacterized protein C10orf107 [Trichoplax sp. H2]|eukprot:RDD45545.1 Uncharacterized protein C10orf107 [Trichoplax sp. H2]